MVISKNDKRKLKKIKKYAKKFGFKQIKNIKKWKKRNKFSSNNITDVSLFIFKENKECFVNVYKENNGKLWINFNSIDEISGNDPIKDWIDKYYWKNYFKQC